MAALVGDCAVLAAAGAGGVCGDLMLLLLLLLLVLVLVVVNDWNVLGNM